MGWACRERWCACSLPDIQAGCSAAQCRASSCCWTCSCCWTFACGRSSGAGQCGRRRHQCGQQHSGSPFAAPTSPGSAQCRGACRHRWSRTARHGGVSSGVSSGAIAGVEGGPSGEACSRRRGRRLRNSNAGG
jgi:hypothetical protein